jgi:NAD(P)-dependent dehydrogenase (short-subunit alcohol dehydrogenase family)
LVGRAWASTSPLAPRRVFTSQRRVHAAAAANDDDNNSNSFFLDLADRTDVSTFFTRHRAVSPSPLVLVNNAGVCVAGHSADAFKVSLDVNCWAPALLAEGAAAATHGDNSPDVTVVNVSSGEGELVFLHSDVAHRVRALDSVAVSEE